MPKFKEIVSNIFEEKKQKSGGLKLFYTVDIVVKEDEPIAAEPAPVAAAPTAQAVPPAAPEVAAESFYDAVGFYLNEETIGSRRTGMMIVPEYDMKDIQTIDDLMDYLADKKEKDGKPIMSEFAVELVLTLTGGDSATQQVSDLLRKDDKVLIEVDYGEDKTDSIGFKVLKRAGVSSASIMMKKDSDILPGKFSTESFNNQIITYRNGKK